MEDTSNVVDAGIALERRGLRDRVHELVLEKLMSPDIEMGSRLSIDALAAELNVSPTPVREALVLLERTGLVTREAHKGYRVAPPISDRHLDALFDARCVIEGGAVELVARVADTVVPLLEEALNRQREVTSRVKSAAAVADIPVSLLREYSAVDWSFHQLIFEASENPFLIDMSGAISTRVHRMRQTAQTGVSDADEAVAEHAAVLDALRTGDPRRASLAMRHHIEAVRARARADARGGNESAAAEGA